jgi:hypothetical protein
MITLIKKLFGKKKTDELSKDPEGNSPNCWGYLEYGNLIRKKFNDQQIAINNHDSTAQNAFIMEFVVTHINGIKLKSSTNGLQCPTCRTVYNMK